MHPYLAEFIGTALLVVFGNGVVANVVLARTKGHNSGWIVITAGWAFGVFIGAFCAAPFSGAHIDPAVTIAKKTAGLVQLLPPRQLGIGNQRAQPTCDFSWFDIHGSRIYDPLLTRKEASNRR